MHIFALALAFFWIAPAFAEPYPIKVQGTRQASGALVRAHNDGPIPISVIVTFTEFENLNTSEAVPIVAVIIVLSLIPPFLEYRKHKRAQPSGT